MYLFLKKGWLKSVTSALNFNILLSLPGGKPATEESSKEPSLISWERTMSPRISLRGLGMPLAARGTYFPPSLFSFSRISHSCKVILTIAPSATCLGCSEDHLREWLQESFMNSPLGQRATGMKMAIGCSRQSTPSGVWGPGGGPQRTSCWTWLRYWLLRACLLTSPQSLQCWMAAWPRNGAAMPSS